VAEVRKKLGPDGPPIETVRGHGYRLVPPTRQPVPGRASTAVDDA
jgi:biotin operon repressor